jgi:CubicO group peptidase (beta-lactamase class C family)
MNWRSSIQGFGNSGRFFNAGKFANSFVAGLVTPPETMRAIVFSFLPLFMAAQSFAADSAVLHRLDGTTVPVKQAESLAAAELMADHVSGAELAIIEQGRVAWTYSFGVRDAARHLHMTPDTDLWAASITKAVFATWVMRLVEQHRIELDRPIAQMLSKPLHEYPSYQAIAAGLAGDPEWQHVTPRMLLSHTSGLANLAVLEPDHKLHLHFVPGTRFAYSGDGLNILQLAIEQTLGEPIDQAMDRDIFKPLGMSRTGMVWRPEFDENSALRYDAGNGLIGATHRDAARGAGSMETTVHDLSLFTAAFLGNKILAPATRAEMLRSQITIHSAHQFPTLDEATGKDGENVALAYGLGWGLLTKTPYGEAFCMMLLTNSDNGELAFRPLLEKLLGDSVTPWEWEAYTRDSILRNEEHAR